MIEEEVNNHKMVTQDVNNLKQGAQLSFRNNFWVNKYPLVRVLLVTVILCLF